MPELPEVETVCEGLRQNIIGLNVSNITLTRPDLRIPFPEKLHDMLCGKTVTQILRRAKYILILFNDGKCLAIHLGMSGQILIINDMQKHALRKHDHMIITFSDGSAFALNDARRFGMVFLFDYKDIDQHSAFVHLGPEPLGNDFSAPVLHSKLKSKQCAIKIAIMDQRVVVGVGNIYACEALFRAGIDPRQKASKVTKGKTEELVKHIRQVLGEAIEAGGSSLKDYKTVDGDLGYFQHSFQVYNREGEACVNCKCDISLTGGIQRIVQGGRSTFFCAEKQR